MTDMVGLRTLCERMASLQREKERIDAELAEVNKELDLHRKVKIPEAMAELGLKNATFEGLGRVQLASDLYASTREGQKEAAMQWLRDTGYDGMIVETYNASSIKALFRRMIEDNIPIPDDMFNVTPFIRASIVRA